MTQASAELEELNGGAALPADRTSEGNAAERVTGVTRRWDFWLCLVSAVLAASIAPLDDPDLPMHLLTGEWILSYSRLPVEEPFAWTRAGAPFYAYSWLPEVLYALGWRASGALGVSLVHAAIAGMSAWAVWWLAATEWWTVWSARIVAAVHIMLWSQMQAAARPQLVLAVAMPLAWASAALFVRHMAAGQDERTSRLPAGSLIVATLSGALAVNSHLLFPLTLAPVVRILAAAPLSAALVRRALLWVVAMLVGFALTPNVMHLGGMLVLNLAPNALFGATSPIVEHEAGFKLLAHSSIGTRLLVVALLMLPLTRPVAESHTRSRVWIGLAWVVGLVLFGMAVRGLLLWWLLVLPWMAMACGAIPLPRSSRVATVTLGAWVVLVLSSVPQTLRASARSARVDGLSHPYAHDLTSAVRILECAIAPDASKRGLSAVTRGMTNFDYGSYLAWRVPQVSWSIDGRTIFPDSVAAAEAMQELRHGEPRHQPWTHANVVVFSTGHATLGRIAADSAWMPLVRAEGEPRVPVELWVRTVWWMGVAHRASCTRALVNVP